MRSSLYTFTMTLEQFFILLDNTSYGGFYNPGQMVSGNVTIRASLEIKTTGLQMIFCGKGLTDWVEERHTSGNKTTRAHYTGSETYFDLRQYIFGDGTNQCRIPPGESTFPFSFQLPAGQIPSSYVGVHGSVEYSLQGTVKRSFLEKNYKANIRVLIFSPLCLSLFPEALQPVVLNNVKTFCCLWCASGPLSMVAKLTRRGYLPGEIIIVEGEVNNQSDRTVKKLTAGVIETTTFFSTGFNKHWITVPNTLVSAELHCMIRPGDVGFQYRFELMLPSGSPANLVGCNIIQVDYTVQLMAHVNGIAVDFTIECPIVLGTACSACQLQFTKFEIKVQSSTN